jgi:hypothetical protein
MCLCCSTAWAFPPGFIGAACSGTGAAACSGDYGLMTQGAQNPNLVASQIRLMRVPACSGGTPTLKLWFQQISIDSREVIPVVYSDNAGEPNTLLWNRSTAYYNASVGATGTQVSFATSTSFTGDYLWIGVMTESSSTATYNSTTAGASRYHTQAGFGTSYLPATWDTVNDTAGTTVTYSWGMTY